MLGGWKQERLPKRRSSGDGGLACWDGAPSTLQKVTRPPGLDAITKIPFSFARRVQKGKSPGKAPVNNNCTLY